MVQYIRGDNMTTGQLIQQARKKAKLTQAELGARLGVSGSMIGQYENDFRHPKTETIKRIATALGLSSHDELLPAMHVNLSDFLDPQYAEMSSEPGNNALLLSAFSKLNNWGQHVAIERIIELGKIPDYQRVDDTELSE